jgi:DMSO/TMAO reductase YedYZ molybdopterin-dependent catalytic subunit
MIFHRIKLKPRIKFILQLITLLVLLLSSVVALACSQQATFDNQTIPGKQAAETGVPFSAAQPDQSGVRPSDTTRLSGQQLEKNSEIIVDESASATITPTAELATTGSTPIVDISSYRLKIDGFVDNPLSLTYDEIKKLPSVTGVILLICPDLFINNAQWTGVPVSSLLDAARVRPGATRITFTGIDGYTQSLAASATRDKGVFLAYIVNGEPLPPEQGYPLRLVVRGKTGNLWVKWIDRIEVN